MSLQKKHLAAVKYTKMANISCILRVSVMKASVCVCVCGCVFAVPLILK